MGYANPESSSWIRNRKGRRRKSSAAPKQRPSASRFINIEGVTQRIQGPLAGGQSLPGLLERTRPRLATDEEKCKPNATSARSRSGNTPSHTAGRSWRATPDSKRPSGRRLRIEPPGDHGAPTVYVVNYLPIMFASEAIEFACEMFVLRPDPGNFRTGEQAIRIVRELPGNRG